MTTLTTYDNKPSADTQSYKMPVMYTLLLTSLIFFHHQGLLYINHKPANQIKTPNQILKLKMIKLFHIAKHIPHYYQSLIPSNRNYLSNKFLGKSAAVTTLYGFSVTIDSPSVSNGAITYSSSNEHGETDYAIWHHCIKTTSCNTLVVLSDTDIWVYGLGLRELRLLEGKQTYIHRGNIDSFIDINHAVTLISNHQLALYLLTGCDYISSFYMCTKIKFLEAFIQHQVFVCPSGCFLKIQYIHDQAWIQLVTVVYYTKFKSFLD